LSIPNSTNPFKHFQYKNNFTDIRVSEFTHTGLSKVFNISSAAVYTGYYFSFKPA